MQPAPPAGRPKLELASPRPPARAIKLASALRSAHTAREQRQVQATAVAMQKPVEDASDRIIGRVAQLETSLVKPTQVPEATQGPEAAASSQVASQKREVEPLDRNDLGEADFSHHITSPRTGLLGGMGAGTGVAGVVQKWKKNHEATKPERSECDFTIRSPLANFSRSHLASLSSAVATV